MEEGGGARRASTDALLRGDDRTLVEQTVDWMRRRIDARIVRPGTRVASIRALAVERGVSRFTIVEAYERLVAHGYLESRRGSGFYVREQAPPSSGQDGREARVVRGARDRCPAHRRPVAGPEHVP